MSVALILLAPLVVGALGGYIVGYQDGERFGRLMGDTQARLDYIQRRVVQLKARQR